MYSCLSVGQNRSNTCLLFLPSCGFGREDRYYIPRGIFPIYGKISAVVHAEYSFNYSSISNEMDSHFPSLSFYLRAYTLKIDTHTHFKLQDIYFSTFHLSVVYFTCPIYFKSVYISYIAFIQCFVLLDKLLICFECILIKRSNIVYCFQYKNKFVLDERLKFIKIFTYIEMRQIFRFIQMKRPQFQRRQFTVIIIIVCLRTNIIKCLFIMFKQNSIQKM